MILFLVGLQQPINVKEVQESMGKEKLLGMTFWQKKVVFKQIQQVIFITNILLI